MALIGEELEESLKKQIDTRQEKLGSLSPDAETITFANSNTSWIRAASSVNISSPELAGLGDLPFLSGDKAAKNSILFGGVTNIEGIRPFEAFSSDPAFLDTTLTGHYGWGGNPQKWGYSPPPSLQSLTIKALNRGAIRKAELSIIAHNPDQFRIIDALYMRLGFTILVEWGHTTYFTNTGTLVTKPDFDTKAFNQFMGIPPSSLPIKYLLESLDGGYAQDPYVLQEQALEDAPVIPNYEAVSAFIDEERGISSYNYDGFIGYISNFNWKFNPDGTYVANISVITKGGLIESLKINHASIDKNSSNQGHSQTLTTILDKWRDSAKSGLSLEPSDNYEYNAASFYSDYGNQNKLFGNLFKKDAELIIHRFSNDPNTAQVYCTLGLLLRVIEDKCLFYDKDKNPIVKIKHAYWSDLVGSSLPDEEKKKKASLMLRHPYQNSVDPGVCMLFSEVPSTLVSKESPDGSTGNERVNASSIPANADSWEDLFTTENPFKGDIMGIYLNLEYIKKTLIDSEKEGRVALNDFISNILTGVARVTGNINKFHLSYNEVSNTFEIYDDVTIPFEGNQSKAQGIINVFAREPEKGLGTFVKDVSFSSKIFPKIQNLVAIAAQNSTGETIGEQVASYQRLNKGLTDRIATGGANTFEVLNNPNPNPNPYNTYRQAIHNISKHFISTYVDHTLPSTDTRELQTTLGEILNYDLQWRSNNGEFASPFFMPVELTLTLHGISGFKLFQKFDITPDYILPSYIPSNLNFIIQGISHDLKDNEWTTTLNTLCWNTDLEPTEFSADLEMPIVGTPTEGEKGNEATPDDSDVTYENDEGVELDYPPLGSGERSSVAQLTISEAGLDLIKSFEGFRADAYPDPASGNEPITIGYGTIKYANGSKVKMGDTITRERAEVELRDFVRKRCETQMKTHIKVPLTQQEFDAIASWLYNCGPRRIKPGGSTLGKLINNKQYLAAANEFPKWNKAGSPKVPMAGLTRRRVAERSLYLTNNPGDPVT